MSGIALVVLMFVLIFLGLPVTFSLLGSCLVFFLTNDLPLASFVQKMAVSMNSFSLIALPFFVLAGNLMNTGGITKRLFAFANELLGWLRGGLCYVAIVSNAIFSALSGSAMANAAGLGLMTIKEMKENGYDEDLSTCLIASASILGPIIPPSVILIVYGVTASVSIKKLFLGGIAPGVLFCILMAIFVNLLGRKNGKIPPKSDIHFSAQSLWKSFKGAFWALLMPVIILGGVFSGVFTATESGAIACLYAVIIGLFVHKDMTPKDILHTMLDTGKTTATILVISGAASLLGFCLTFDRVPQELAAAMVDMISSRAVMMVIFMVVYLFLGCIMGATAIVITTVPIFAPICTAMGIDLVYFGVFVGILMSVGSITPPVGTVMYVLCDKLGMSIERYTQKMIPWFGLVVVFCLMLAFCPQIITFLPNLMQ